MYQTKRIQLTHPEGRQAPSMELRKYQALKASFMSCWNVHKMAGFPELLLAVAKQLKQGKVETAGQLEWNLLWVTLDLQARKELVLDHTSVPARYLSYPG